MCPKIIRKGQAEFQTTQGHPIPKGQVLHLDYHNDKLVCLNSEQTEKPPPPNYWFHKKIKCVDYKIRHKCECLYGCLGNLRINTNAFEYKIHENIWCLVQEKTDLEAGSVRVQLPDTETLFDECDWRPFVDTSTPDNGTWDAEVRGTILRKNKVLSKHICNDNLVDAMYIDTRRVEDDMPWHETGELITKNTPM